MTGEETVSGAGGLERAARAHAGLVCTMEWYRDALDARGRVGMAERLHALSRHLARSASRHAQAVEAIDALRGAVEELARPAPDHNRLVLLLDRVAAATNGARGVLDSLRAVIAEIARSPAV